MALVLVAILLPCEAVVAQRANKNRTLVKEWRDGDYIVRRYLTTSDAESRAEYEILYAINSANVVEEYEHNDKVVSRLDELFEEFRRDTLNHIRSIAITGYASPDGTVAFNSDLARRRAQQLGQMIRKRYNLPPNTAISISSEVEPWSATADKLEHSRLDNRGELVRIVNSEAPPMTIDRSLKQQAQAWSYLKSDVLPEMRRTTVEVTYTHDELADTREYSPAEEVLIIETVEERPHHEDRREHKHHSKHHRRDVVLVNEWEGVIIDMGASAGDR